MWSAKYNCPPEMKITFSDGRKLKETRGGNGVSSRLIVHGKGFLDFTDICPPNEAAYVDFNGQLMSYNTIPETVFNVTLENGRKFTVTTDGENGPTIESELKPLPTISNSDAEFFTEMINEKYVPYQGTTDSRGQTIEEIRKLGLKYFPFTNFSFQLAMSLYDWTTPSFARIVLMKIFEYTSIGESPYPLDLSNISKQIWDSNWGSYNPRNKDYMNSFMMSPAHSENEVMKQLETNHEKLQEFSNIENRLIAAAIQSMPRTSTKLVPKLYSGQPSMNQLGLDHFGIEFLQCPLNSGPISVPLEIPFDVALDKYICEGEIITTKMVLEFATSYYEALHYNNGIIIIVSPPQGAVVWDNVSNITPLSDDPESPIKIEYLFAPGTDFRVQKVIHTIINKKKVVEIYLQVQ